MNHSQPHLPHPKQSSPPSTTSSSSRRASPLLAGSASRSGRTSTVRIPDPITAHRKAVANLKAVSEARRQLEANIPTYEGDGILPGEAWRIRKKKHPDFRAALARQQEAFLAEEEALNALFRAASQATSSDLKAIASYICDLTRESDGAPVEGASPAYRCMAAIAGIRFTSQPSRPRR